MVSLKPTSIITKSTVTIFIVWTIIDRVYSNDNEVEICRKSIIQLYSYRVVRLPDTSRLYFGRADDDASIGDDRLKMFKKGFLVFNATEIHLINNNFADRIKSTPTPTKRKNLIQKLDEYTIGYFNKFLEKVSINGKDNFQNPVEFCDKQYEDEDEGETLIDLCKGILQEKFQFNNSLNGSQIFDIFYKEWSEYQIKMAYSLKEVEEVRELALRLTPPEDVETVKTKYANLIQQYSYSIDMFYFQFVDKLEHANVSQMPTPKEFCDDYIKNEASKSASKASTSANEASTSVNQAFEKLNI